MRNGNWSVGGWVLVAVLGLVGCGATTTGADPEGDVTVVQGSQGRSGERLTAKAYRAGDAVQFRHFHDELLGFDCQFSVDSAGTPRCFPVNEDLISYLDARCSEPAIQDYQRKPGDWLVEWSQQACPGALEPRGEAFVVAEEIYPAPINGLLEHELYRRAEDGRCVTGGGEPKGASPVYRLSRIPATELAAGRVRTFETTAGLRVDRVFAEDGAEANLGVRLADGTACELQRDGSCLGFGAFQYVGEECPGSSSSVGVSGAELLDVGPGPLHSEVYELSSTAGSFRLPEGSVGQFLTENGTTCQVHAAADGTLRCVDELNDVQRSGFFEDSACESPFFLPNDESIDDVDDANLLRVHAVIYGANFVVEEVRELSPLHRGAIYEYVNGSCEVASSAPSFLLSVRGDMGLDVLPEVEDARLP